MSGMGCWENSLGWEEAGIAQDDCWGIRHGTGIYTSLGRGWAGQWLSRLGWEGVGNAQYDC